MFEWVVGKKNNILKGIYYARHGCICLINIKVKIMK